MGGTRMGGGLKCMLLTWGDKVKLMSTFQDRGGVDFWGFRGVFRVFRDSGKEGKN